MCECEKYKQLKSKLETLEQVFNGVCVCDRLANAEKENMQLKKLFQEKKEHGGKNND